MFDIEDPNKFAAEWQVRDDEPMLFQSVREPQYPQMCHLPKIDENKKSVVSEEEAKKACAGWSASTIKMCIKDVMSTGNFDLAATASL